MALPGYHPSWLGFSLSDQLLSSVSCVPSGWVYYGHMKCLSLLKSHDKAFVDMSLGLVDTAHSGTLVFPV